MPKKTAAAVAASVVGLVLAASIAIALNLGILSGTQIPTDPTSTAEALEPGIAAALETDEAAAAADSDGVGSGLELFPEGSRVITVYVDEPVPESPSAPAGERSAGSALTQETPREPTSSSAGVSYPSYDAGDAGQVALEQSGAGIGFWGAYPADGWTYYVDQNGPREVDVRFSKGATEIRFKAELEDGTVRTRVEVRGSDAPSSRVSDDDDHDDDDHSGRGRDLDDDDHDDDDYDDDDDHDDDDYDDDRD